MRLITSTRDRVTGGRPCPGFPILLWDSMDSCTPVLEKALSFGRRAARVIGALIRGGLGVLVLG
jgi:hypothetical protein